MTVIVNNNLPSNADCTLLLRLCVASNALAVAADDGGLVPLMLAVTSQSFKRQSQTEFQDQIFIQHKFRQITKMCTQMSRKLLI